MQKMLFPCFLFMEFLKSVVLKDGGVNVIPGNNIKTTTHSPSNIPAGDFTANKTGNHFKNLTEKDREENSAHSGNNLSEGTTTNIVALSVSLTIISALSISLVVFLKKRGFCKRTQMQETESYEMNEPLNN